MNSNSVTHDSAPPLTGLSRVKTVDIYFAEGRVLGAECLQRVKIYNQPPIP